MIAVPAAQNAGMLQKVQGWGGGCVASLRLRLVLIPSAILVLGLAATIGYELAGAAGRVRAEVSSGMRFGRILVGAALVNARTAGGDDAARASLAAELPRVRHIDFRLLDEPPSLAEAALRQVDPARSRVPAWFARLFDLAVQRELFPIVSGGVTVGNVAMLSNPLDEIAEIWDELVWLCALLLAASVAIVGLIHWNVRRALRPVADLARGFDRLERGDYTAQLAPIGVAELARIGEQFNSLGRSLGDLEEDNHRLIDALIGLQEAERKEIAHELHDEFGPLLFGIRAEAASLRRGWQRGQEQLDTVAERAEAIGRLADGIQRINARILARLRPLALAELGLAEALHELVAGWRERCPQIAWNVRAEEVVLDDERMELALYRVGQECLTNAARHAGAKRVEVVLERVAGPAPAVRLLVRDDGKGLPPGLRFGFGLLGMSERVRALHGRLSVGNGPAGGAEITVTLPLGAGTPA
jgi:two-component system sensor histidine kinase UhpB